MIKRILYITSLVILICTTSAQADFDSYFANLKQDVKETYNAGTWNAMLPLRTWHNRLTYDREHLRQYNEEPWGFGVGLTRYEGYDWHGLYALAFMDSNDYIETMFGYAYLKNKPIDCFGNWLFGYGYTIGLTQRHEYSYIPIPLPLPLLALTYKNFSLNATYVPGIKNDGNVLFTWIRVDM